MFAYITDGTPTLHVVRLVDNTLVTPITTGAVGLVGIAASPAGSSLYATDAVQNVWFINPATGASRAARVPHTPSNIAVAPDGSTIYVSEFNPSHDYVSDLVAMSLDGSIVRNVRTVLSPGTGLALSYPDGAWAYVTNSSRRPAVSVRTSDFTVGEVGPGGTLKVATQPSPYVPLIHYQPILFFQTSLEEAVLSGSFGLGPGNTGLDLPEGIVTLEIADVTLTIPANSFHKNPAGGFSFAGAVNGVKVQAVINPSQSGYQFNFQFSNFPLKGIVNPVTVRMIVGNNIGGATINAQFTQ